MFKSSKREDKKKKVKEDKNKKEEVPSRGIRSTPERVPQRLAREEPSQLEADDQKRREEEEAKRKAERAEQRRKEKERKRIEEQKQKEREKAEAERKKQEEQRRKYEEERRRGEDPAVEIKALEEARPSSNETEQTFSDLYDPLKLFSGKTFEVYSRLMKAAREVNERYVIPEIVLVGPQSHGKSALLEAFLGVPFNILGLDGVTKRPLFLQLINNPDCSQPKITFRRDVAAKENSDVVVEKADIAAHLKKRNKVNSLDGIYMKWEHKHVWNMTLIDTPGLILEACGIGVDGSITSGATSTTTTSTTTTNSSSSDTQKSRDEVAKAVIELMRPLHRRLVVVEEASSWDRTTMRSFVQQVDPEYSRCTFIFTKFQAQLQRFTSTQQVNRYFQGILPDVKTFFSTLPSEKVRAKFSDEAAYTKKVWQAAKRDFRTLELLQYDKSNDPLIGCHAWRKDVLMGVWQSFQDFIPQILKRLRTRQEDAVSEVKQISELQSELDVGKLRAIASAYVIQFLQVVESLIAGTSEGKPGETGQTLSEEKHQHGDGEWLDNRNQVVRFDPEEWGIPYWDAKLYGGQQFERLLSEFRAVAKHTRVPAITIADVATATGLNKLNNVPNYAWAASDLAQQKSKEVLAPLIKQLTSRAVYILKRLAIISEKVLAQRVKKQNSISLTEQSPYFTYHVKDLYNKFIDDIAKVVATKASDEFYSTRTIYWHLTEQGDHSLPMDSTQPEETKAAVEKLVKELYSQIRDRVIKNVVLKFYNFFLVPMQTGLWNHVQAKVNCLTDDQLEQNFDVESTRRKLQARQAKLEEIINKSESQEKELLAAATEFAHLQ